MGEREIVGTIVESVFPDDCAVIGQTNLQQLLTGKETTTTTITGGHNFPIEAPLELVAAAIAVSRQLLLLIDDLKKRGENPEPERVAKTAQSQGITASLDSLELGDKVVELAKAALKWEPALHGEDR